MKYMISYRTNYVGNDHNKISIIKHENHKREDKSTIMHVTKDFQSLREIV